MNIFFNIFIDYLVIVFCIFSQFKYLNKNVVLNLKLIIFLTFSKYMTIILLQQN